MQCTEEVDWEMRMSPMQPVESTARASSTMGPVNKSWDCSYFLRSLSRLAQQLVQKETLQNGNAKEKSYETDAISSIRPTV